MAPLYAFYLQQMNSKSIKREENEADLENHFLRERVHRTDLSRFFAPGDVFNHQVDQIPINYVDRLEGHYSNNEIRKENNNEKDCEQMSGLLPSCSKSRVQILTTRSKDADSDGGIRVNERMLTPLGSSSSSSRSNQNSNCRMSSLTNLPKPEYVKSEEEGIKTNEEILIMKKKNVTINNSNHMNLGIQPTSRFENTMEKSEFGSAVFGRTTGNLKNNVRMNRDKLTKEQRITHEKNLLRFISDQKKRMRDSEFLEKSTFKDEIVRKLIQMRKMALGAKENESIREMDEYSVKVSDHKTIKYYSEENEGYVIISEEQSIKDKLDVEKTWKEIFEMLYKQCLYKSDQNIIEKVMRFCKLNNYMIFREEHFSIIHDFHKYKYDCFPPELLLRSSGGENDLMLRPMIIDGIAVQYASQFGDYKCFLRCSDTERMPYLPEFVLSVRPLWEVVFNCLIRGHKATIHLPEYYRKYITPGGLSKVDNVFAFKTLIECGLIEFDECYRIRHKSRWFNVVKEIVEEKNGVFVGSPEYDENYKSMHTFEKSSERIITPTFLNSGEMLLETTIRCRWGNTTLTIPSHKVLYYENDEFDTIRQLQEQLYLKDQINMVYILAKIYPLKALQKACVKQLFYLMVVSSSGIELPGLERDD